MGHETIHLAVLLVLEGERHDLIYEIPTKIRNGTDPILQNGTLRDVFKVLFSGILSTTS